MDWNPAPVADTLRFSDDDGAPQPVRTKEEVRAYKQAWYTAFPDIRCARADMVRQREITWASGPTI